MPTPQEPDDQPRPGSSPPEPDPTGSTTPENPRPGQIRPPEPGPSAAADPNRAASPPVEPHHETPHATDSPAEPSPWVQDQLRSHHPDQPNPQEYPHPEQPAPTDTPHYPHPDTTTPAERAAGTGQPLFSIISFCCAAVCLVFCPIVFGVAGIILGLIGHQRGERLGKWAALTSVVALAIGLILAFVVYKSDAVALG